MCLFDDFINDGSGNNIHIPLRSKDGVNTLQHRIINAHKGNIVVFNVEDFSSICPITNEISVVQFYVLTNSAKVYVVVTLTKTLNKSHFSMLPHILVMVASPNDGSITFCLFGFGKARMEERGFGERVDTVQNFVGIVGEATLEFRVTFRKSGSDGIRGEQAYCGSGKFNDFVGTNTALILLVLIRMPAHPVGLAGESVFKFFFTEFRRYFLEKGDGRFSENFFRVGGKTNYEVTLCLNAANGTGKHIFAPYFRRFI